MSVLIKGMEMPTDCGHCRFAVDGWCYAYGRVNIDALSTYERTNYCPLVPVPPHGRLIDADALAERLLTAWDTADAEGKKTISAVMADDVTPIVVGTPTIIEAEGE